MSSGLQGLVGTMTPEAVLTALQAQLQAQQDATAGQAQQAAGAASEAGTAYQNAAAQPAPEVDPMSAFFPTLFGHIAATIARDPSYVTRAHENIKSEQNALLAVRKQTLQALHDNYVQKAEAARQLGNTEAVTEAHAKLVQVQKQIDVVLKSQELAAADDRLKQQEQGANSRAAGVQAGENARAAAANATRLKAAGMTAAGNAPDLNDYLDESPGGIKYLNAAAVPSMKARQNLVDQARKGKVPVAGTSEQGALEQVRLGLANINEMRGLVSALPATVAERNNPLNYAKRLAQSKLQDNNDYAAINAQRITAIQLDQAVGGLGKGMRINQQLIQAALRNDVPTIHDTQAWAAAKLDTREQLMKNVERAALGQSVNDAVMGHLIRLSARLAKGPKGEEAPPSSHDRYGLGVR